MIADLFEVGPTERRGRGLFAKLPIAKGMVIDYVCERCQIVCRRDELEAMAPERREELMEHTYTTDDDDVILDCSIGRYMNHSCEANVLESEEGFDVAVRAIEQGEEVTCDYRQFNDPDEAGLRCHCGEASCCGIVRCARPIPDALVAMWREKTRSACRSLRLPAELSTGVGRDRITLPGWRLDEQGAWRPQRLAPVEDQVARALSGLLQRPRA